MKVSTVKPPPLPENYSFYNFQIAGHHYSKQKSEKYGVLICEKTGHILKPLQNPPRGESEVKFYTNIWLTDHSGNNKKQNFANCLRNLIPKYYGLRNLPVDGHSAKFLELQNLTGSYRKPCVIDIKIGSRTWDPLATQEKIDYEKSKYPHADSLGFRFLGTMVYRETMDSYEHRDKDWGKNLTENEVVPALRSFFPHDPQTCKVLACCVLRNLNQILTFFSTQRTYLFYSSSILISYEGQMNRELDEILPKNVHDLIKCAKNSGGPNQDCLANNFCSNFDRFINVKMIDFTHVFDQEGSELDENYLHGLKNLIRHVTKFLDSLI